LSSAVKDRVLSTFQQTLALFKQGRKDEVVAGCTLLLQMDPLFDPAKKLMEKLRNPALPINVDTLVPRDERAAIEQAREAMAARDFQRVIHLTTEILTNDLMNDEARILGDEARERIEAGGFIDQFVRKADQHLAAGNLIAAKAEVEKARALDDTHPEIIRLSRVIAARDAGPSSAPPTRTGPAFIVDDPAKQATGRAAAPASDFGFSFEEEKPAEAPASFSGFSFDAPAQAPAEAGFANVTFEAEPASSDSPFGGGFSFDSPQKAPGSAEFDFSTASVSTSPDDQKKIEQYLADGDRAFSAGDYQQAIDHWSRIFLIDVTNDQASERIERAKARRREAEQKSETLLGTAIDAFERGDKNRARADFNEVLRLDPGNATALEYLGRMTGPVEALSIDSPYVPPPPSDEKLDLDFFDDEPLPGGDKPLMPPSSAAVSAPKKAAAPAKPKSSGGRRLPIGAIAGVLGILVLAAGGWFAWTKFINKPQVDPGASQATIVRATALADRGQFDQAIGLLQDIKPGDPLHDRALGMIADLQAKKSKVGATFDGKTPDVYHAEQIAAGRAALAAHDYAAAKAAFENAIKVKPLTPDAQTDYAAAANQVAQLDSAKALFSERKYAEAISNLQPLLVQDPQNQNVQRMITDAHFNLGAEALQTEKTADAIREFDEVLKVNPNDELAKRSRDLAARYDGETKDLLYKIYVKYLPLRTAA
jgi:tetratricopeptide (TPR) repeat protein